MGARRRGRECALQILFQLEFDRSDTEKTIRRYWEEKKAPGNVKTYAEWLVKGVVEHREKVDDLIQSCSEHWRVSRMALVDRNILRVAVYEFLFENQVSPAIVINEALEIGKKFSSDEAAVFINGILDGVRKKLEAGKAESE